MANVQEGTRASLQEAISKIRIYPFPADLCEQVAASVKRRLPSRRTYLNHVRHNATNYDALRVRYELTPREVDELKRAVNRRLIDELNRWHRQQKRYGFRGLPED